MVAALFSILVTRHTKTQYSRTGELDHCIINDSLEFIPEISENPSFDVDDFDIPRASIDKEVLWCMHIFNGRVSGDKKGNIK